MISSSTSAQLVNVPVVGDSSTTQTTTPQQKREHAQEVARDLGVTLPQLHTCAEMRQKPTPGQHLTREQREANKAKVFGCLKQSNPSLTMEKFENIMKSDRKH